MKKSLAYLLLLLCSCSFFVSCGEDEDNDTMDAIDVSIYYGAYDAYSCTDVHYENGSVASVTHNFGEFVDDLVIGADSCYYEPMGLGMITAWVPCRIEGNEIINTESEEVILKILDFDETSGLLDIRQTTANAGNTHVQDCKFERK